MKKLSTWDNRSEFEYEGSIASGTMLYYGDDRSTYVTKEQYEALLNHFKGKTVKSGTSRTQDHDGSVGDWLQTHVARRTIMSYVGAILIHEGYASKGREKATIKFL